ncbi:MAG: CoA transferase [Candidatus Thermoplasmatota archaeon]|nr:CoA transferase [Candidatus Thermoplasmatota archaeon]
METVIDATRLIPGAITTRILCDRGYNIIKFEDTERGDYMGDLSPGANAFLNHGKKSISVNLKTDKGKSILYSLIETASVFIESFTAGVAERLGISYEVLHRINPELVYCSIKGYSDNPEIPGHDINFTAMSGIDITLPVQIADVGSGMYAALEIINHLKNHDYSRITVNMSEIPLLFNAYSLFTENNVLNGEYPSYRIYNVSDGKIALGCLEQKFWTNFTEAIKRPDLKYSRLDISVNEVVEIILSAYKSMEVLKLGRKYNFPVSRVRNRNEIISEMYNGTAPRHGEDTFEILKNNHYSEEEIKNLMENKIIK